MIKKQKIYVAGHRGMIGSAIVRKLKSHGYNNILTSSRGELDLTNQTKVQNFFEAEKPDQVYLCAAKVGGVHANNAFPAEFIYENLMIQLNIIHAAYLSNVKKLLFLGSSCIYPRDAIQPMKEESLLSGYLESTNEPYAIAKISGIKLCESYNRQFDTDFRSVMPSNLYGIGDNYHPTNSHVIPGLIRRFHDAKIQNTDTVEIWGSGDPKREFLFVDDMASASIHVMDLSKEEYKKITQPMLSHINIGFNEDISILNLAKLISEVIGFEGEIISDKSKPDGTKQKLMDSSKLYSLGWQPKYNLKDGLKITYEDFLNKIKDL